MEWGPRVGRSVTLTHHGASELSQRMEGTSAGALIPEIVRLGFQELLEAEGSAAIGAAYHERCPDEPYTHRNCYRRRAAHHSGGRLVPGHPPRPKVFRLR